MPVPRSLSCVLREAADLPDWSVAIRYGQEQIGTIVMKGVSNHSYRLLPRSRNCSGFTLVELLVVICIIAILAGVTVAGVGSALRMAKNAQASTQLNEIVTATQSFYTDNGSYPVAENYQGSDVTFGEDTPYTSQLMDVLRADYQGWDAPGTACLNPRQIVYTNWKYVPTAKPAAMIGEDGQPYDPWSRVYIIRIDTNYDGTVANPYSANAGTNPLPNTVIGWSFGSDSQGGEGDKNVGTSKDDIISW